MVPVLSPGEKHAHPRRGGREEGGRISLVAPVGAKQTVGAGHSPGSVLTSRTLSTLLSFQIFLGPEKVGWKQL